jgi:hypothetical protein
MTSASACVFFVVADVDVVCVVSWYTCIFSGIVYTLFSLVSNYKNGSFQKKIIKWFK